MNSGDTGFNSDVLRRFDLSALTDAGLRRGYTTGSCATAAVKAALLSLLCIRVALGDRPDEIVLAPGNLGQRLARSYLGLPPKRVVQMSNFIGFALECLEHCLAEQQYRLPVLWLVGHPGKLARILAGDWDTHSGRSLSAIRSISRLAQEFGLPMAALEVLGRVKSIEEAIELIPGKVLSPAFWAMVERRIATVTAQRLPRVERIAVRLFRMDGESLSW